jgi:beta-ureidopropionase / N-carbamoyl-L-amino-acid hydrolase
VEPNSTNGIPSRVRGWLDARAQTPELLAQLLDELEQQAVARAGRDRTTLEVRQESRTDPVAFDTALADRIAGALGDPPRLDTAAGHDAGILATAGIPTAMLYVRNPTGVSHSPEEYAEPADCLAGVDALGTVLAELLG